MSLPLSKSIMPMSDLRIDPEKVKLRLKDSPVIITNKGKPDFGVCDLETLEIATQVKALRDLLIQRKKSSKGLREVDEVFKELNEKYGF